MKRKKLILHRYAPDMKLTHFWAKCQGIKTLPARCRLIIITENKKNRREGFREYLGMGISQSVVGLELRSNLLWRWYPISGDKDEDPLFRDNHEAQIHNCNEISLPSVSSRSTPISPSVLMCSSPSSSMWMISLCTALCSLFLFRSFSLFCSLSGCVLYVPFSLRPLCSCVWVWIA